MGDETQQPLHNLFTAPDWVQEGEMKSQKYYRLVETTTPELADQRKKLADDIKKYLASGKEIQQIPKGYSKFSEQPMRSWIEESRKRKFGEH
jgi:hypothetical protein